MDSWEICTLEQAHKETVGHQFRVTSSAILEQREDTPENIESGYQIVQAHLGKKKGEGQLPKDGPKRVYCLQVHQFVPMEVEVVRQAGDVSIV